MKIFLFINSAIIVTALAGIPAAAPDHGNTTYESTWHRPRFDLHQQCAALPDTQLQDQDYTDHQLPWQRINNTKVTVQFETKNVTPEYITDMRNAAAEWNKSPCLRIKLASDCSPGGNCVTVSLKRDDTSQDDGNFDAIEKGGYTTGGHIDLYYQKLDQLGSGAKLNVVTHEMGHAIGLKHRLAPRVLMNGDTYTDIFQPDNTDYKNLLALYGTQE